MVEASAMIPPWITTSLGMRSVSSARIVTDAAVVAMCHETFIVFFSHELDLTMFASRRRVRLRFAASTLWRLLFAECVCEDVRKQRSVQSRMFFRLQP